MRVAFLGTPRSAVPALQALLAADHRLALVITQPDRPAGRSSVPRPPEVKRAALSAGLPVIQPDRVKSVEFLETIAGASPDVLVVVAYGRILPEPVLSVAPHGAVNLHFSLLPRWRGAAPVQWALASGDAVTGVTTMRMNALLDEGDVLLRAELPIGEGEHAPALTDRLSAVGAALLVETLARIEEGTARGVAQDPSLATYAPRLAAADGDVGPALSAGAIEGRVRGFDPWPGAWATSRGRRIRLVEGRALGGEVSKEPGGTVLGLMGDSLRIVCGGGSVLAVSALQPEGRRVIGARDAVNGRVLRPGDRIE